MNIQNENFINKSLRLAQLEKLLIIEREVDFIGNILKYFKGYTNNQEISEVFAKDNIKRLEYDIKNIFTRIKNIQNLNMDEMTACENLKFIIFYDYSRTQIEEMLYIVEALYVKMNQLFGEMLNQYLPYPTFFGRRYSSNGLMMYLDNLYRDMLKKLIADEDQMSNDLVLGWSYNTGFKHKILRNKNITRINYNHETHNDYIELPYWYYELPFLIPAITHEVVSISLRKENSYLYKNHYKKFAQNIKDFFDDRSNKLVREISEILGYDMFVKDLCADIFADIVSYKIHGYSYFFTLLHNLLAEGIAKDFLEVIYKKDGKTIKKYNFQPNDWFFSPKREHNHLRVYFMLCCFSQDSDAKIKDKDKIVEHIKSLLDSIITLKDENELLGNNKLQKIDGGFEKLYKNNYPNYFSTFQVVQNYLKQLLESMIEAKCEFDTKEYKQDKYEYYNRLWDSRYEKIKNYPDKNIVPYKGEFRRLIHRYISNIKYLEKNEEIFILILRKLRKDKINKSKKSDNDKQKEAKNFIESINAMIDDNGGWRAYGIYDLAFIQKRDSQIDLTQNHEKNFNEKIYYFDAKSILMRMCETIEHEVKGGDFSLILNIELKKNTKKENGYDNLEKAILDIKEVLKTKNFQDFKKANIYKSLGPKDLTVIVENCKFESLYDIIDNINNVDQVNRTFSIFCSKIGNSYDSPLEIGENHFLTSYIRVPKSGNNQNKFLKQIKNHNASIYQTTGVMDFKIDWRENVDSINELFDIYTKLLPYITDYQTKIEKLI